MYLRHGAPPGPKQSQFEWLTHVLAPYIPYLIRPLVRERSEERPDLP